MQIFVPVNEEDKLLFEGIGDFFSAFMDFVKKIVQAPRYVFSLLFKRYSEEMTFRDMQIAIEKRIRELEQYAEREIRECYEPFLQEGILQSIKTGMYKIGSTTLSFILGKLLPTLWTFLSKHPLGRLTFMAWFVLCPLPIMFTAFPLSFGQQLAIGGGALVGIYLFIGRELAHLAEKWKTSESIKDFLDANSKNFQYEPYTTTIHQFFF